MSSNPYEYFSKDDLILRDQLAIDRTLLANERTVLSYLRGAIALIIAGVTFVHFVEYGVLHYLGISLVPIGLITGVVGIIRYIRLDKCIRSIRESINSNEKKS